MRDKECSGYWLHSPRVSLFPSLLLIASNLINATKIDYDQNLNDNFGIILIFWTKIIQILPLVLRIRRNIY